MGILECASGASIWRGYEYYENKHVSSFVKLSDDEYEGVVSGSGAEPYQVKINIAHARKSKCNCPHADGKRIVCKHMVALFFTIFPEEAAMWMNEVEEYEREEEERERERYNEIKRYVYSMSKEELRQKLIQYIIDEEDRFYY